MAKIIKNTNWIHKNNYYIKEISFKTNLTYDEILKQIHNNVRYLKTQNEISNVIVKESINLKRNKGEEQSDYVSRLANMGNETFTHSHYTKENKPITITLNDGSIVNGIIRVSNHKVDIGTFIKNQTNINFCISIVVGEKPRINSDIKIPNERIVHIFEYVLEKEWENKETVLMNIADKIINIKENGWNINTDVGMGKIEPIERTNGKKLFNNNSNNSIIKESILKIINNYNNKNN